MRIKVGRIVVFFVLLYILTCMVETNEAAYPSKRKLETDGFCSFYSPLYLIGKDFPSKLVTDVNKILPDYQFIDYIYKIRNGVLSKFHRDVTSSKHNYKTKHPVYTLILYKYQGELLSVVPGSHLDYPFAFGQIVNLYGDKGTAFLFDSDILHSGGINECKFRDVVQYKLCHKDDLDKLTHLKGIRKEKVEICDKTFATLSARKLSYFFQLPINYWFYSFLTEKYPSDTWIGYIQTFIPLSYYNNV